MLYKRGGCDGYINKDISGKKSSGLTEREKEIIVLISKGKSYKEIAYDPGLSFHTVKTYVKNIMYKTGLRNKLELIKEFLSES
mgnify:CR=1 FL=1